MIHQQLMALNQAVGNMQTEHRSAKVQYDELHDMIDGIQFDMNRSMKSSVDRGST